MQNSLAEIVFEGFFDFLKNPMVIAALALAIVGLTFAFLSKPIAMSVKGKSTLEEKDKVVLGIRIFSLMLCVIGLVLIFV